MKSGSTNGPLFLCLIFRALIIYFFCNSIMEHIVILTGAGISAESGLKTFRDSDGLWEGYNIEDVATPQAWRRDPQMVQDFYNERRKAVLEASPNAAHYALAQLEAKYT